MAIEPIWARKPKHKQTVVATSRGWEVATTGELLVSVRNLDQKIKELHSTPTATEEVVIEQQNENVIALPEKDSVSVEEVPTKLQEVVVADTPTGLELVENAIVVKTDLNEKDVVETILEEKKDEITDEQAKDTLQTSLEAPSDAKVETIVVPAQAEIVNDQPVKRKPGRPKKVVKE